MEDNHRTRTILIVDNQPEVLRLYSRGLEVSGHRVITAETVELGMQLVDAAPPDAVLVDLKMPYVNGMGMLYRLRQSHPLLPVAIITGMQNGSLQLQGTSATPFFGILLQDTRYGFFADPIYGGNRDMAAWKMIGFPGARYDYRDWVERHSERYPHPPISIAGRNAGSPLHP